MRINFIALDGDIRSLQLINMKTGKLLLKQAELLLWEQENMMFVDRVNHKISLCKGLKALVSKKEENAKLKTVKLCLIRHGAI